MPASDFDAILTECLERLASGESVAACLARYPQHAPQLGPMLAAAESLRQLGALRMPVSSRLRAQARMRRALVDANGKRAPGSPWWTRGWFRGLAGLAAVLALVLALSNVLAASRPGDWGYSLRAAAERVPAQVVRSPEMRAYAELRVADARLMDLERVVTSGGDAIEPVLDALLASDEAAAQGVEPLSDAARGAVAGRIRGHADALAGLSRFAAETPVQAALAQAGRRLTALAAGLQPTAPQPRPALDPTSAAPTVGPSLTWTPAPEVTRPTATRTPSPTSPSTAAPTASPTAPATPTTTSPVPTATPVLEQLLTVVPPQGAETPESGPTVDGNRGSGKTPEPTDDNSGSGSTPEPTDDHGGSGGAPQPTDDHGGSGNTPEPTDDHGGSGRAPDPTDDRSGRGGGSENTPEPDDQGS
jgi:hypothetical protein